MCEYFGEPIKSGNSRYSQINKWRKYYEIEHPNNGYYYIKRKLSEEEIKQNTFKDDRFDVNKDDEVKSGIYKIYNVETNEIYIGQTTNFKNCFYRHWNNVNEKTYHMLHNGAIFSVIELCDDMMECKEKVEDYIIQYKTNGYNVCNKTQSEEWIYIKVRIKKEDKTKLMEFLEHNIEYK